MKRLIRFLSVAGWAVVMLFLIVCLLIVFPGGRRETPRIPTPEQRDIVKKYDSLPESAKNALMAEDLSGYTVYSASDENIAARSMQYLLTRGAVRGTRDKASLIIETRSVERTAWKAFKENKHVKLVSLIVKDRNGIVLLKEDFVEDPSDLLLWRILHDLTVALGTEQKVSVLQGRYPNGPRDGPSGEDVLSRSGKKP